MSYIKRETTNIIKGVALIFMFMHHFFTFPDWYVHGNAYPILAYFNIPLKICVAIFAFLTGYFYYYTPQKDYAYSLRKNVDLWIQYVVTFFLLLIPACILKVYEASAVKFVLELIGLYQPTMKFCWYVTFYFITMLILPVYSKLSHKNGMLAFLLAASVPSFVTAIFDFVSGNALGGMLFDQSSDFIWFSSVAAGYAFAQYGLFEKMHEGLQVSKTWLRVLLNVLFMIIPFVAKGVTPALSIVYAPLFLFGLVNLCEWIPGHRVVKPVAYVGKYSLQMWFLHCVFFNQCQEITQKILYYPQNSILVLLWGLILCLVVSIPLATLTTWIIKGKDKLIRKLSKDV